MDSRHTRIKIFLLCSAILLPIFSADYNARRVSCVGPALRLGIDMRQPTRATQGEEEIRNRKEIEGEDILF